MTCNLTPELQESANLMITVHGKSMQNKFKISCLLSNLTKPVIYWNCQQSITCLYIPTNGKENASACRLLTWSLLSLPLAAAEASEDILLMLSRIYSPFSRLYLNSFSVAEAARNSRMTLNTWNKSSIFTQIYTVTLGPWWLSRITVSSRETWDFMLGRRWTRVHFLLCHSQAWTDFYGYLRFSKSRKDVETVNKTLF